MISIISPPDKQLYTQVNIEFFISMRCHDTTHPLNTYCTLLERLVQSSFDILILLAEFANLGQIHNSPFDYIILTSKKSARLCVHRVDI
jgi:uroporphyrinogen-III synthase